jgi:hypothetical protein
VYYRPGQTLLQNLWGILAEPELKISLITAKPILATDIARRALAEFSRDAIRDSLGLKAPALPPETSSSSELMTFSDVLGAK